MPTLLPFNFHWYDGVPPLIGVAMNVTLVPVHMVLPGVAAIVTEGTTALLTDITIEFEVTGFGLAHATDDVITTVTISPLANDAF